ncbi:MAG: hypothetical protein NTW19_08910 [Planctomycetota bacterium]|nr:hypothetical protein [Planctomycetota bacterium]
MTPTRSRAAATASTAKAIASPPDRFAPFLWAATLAVLALGLVYALVSVDLLAYWDADPAVGPQQVFMSLTPEISAWLNVATVVAAGLAMLLHALAGGRVRWGAVLLAFAGIAACAYHGRFDGDSLFRGSSWAGGVALALAASHLAQRDRHRRFMAAAIVAMVIPIALQALYFILVERPMTIRMFEAGRDRLFESHGWAPDSPMAKAFVRRLESPDAVGVFNLSNVLGSVSGAIAVLAIAIFIGAVVRRSGREAVVPGILAVMGLATLALSRSKGAATSTVLVVGLLALAWPLARAAKRNRLSSAALALVALAFAAILALGWMSSPETIPRALLSLLFRFHYLQAAAHMVAEDPAGTLLRGLGTGGFVEAYFRTKNPINPEDVTSTHNLFVDYSVMLGLGGIAWSCLALLWLWQAGRHAQDALAAPDTPAIADDRSEAALLEAGRADRGRLLLAAILGLALFLTQYVRQLPGMTPERGLIWIFSTVGFFGVTALLASDRGADRRWMGVGLFAAATLLLTHNQIEMTFFQPGSATLAWLILAVASGSGSDSADAAPGAGSAVAPSAPRRWISLAPGAAMLLVLVPIMEIGSREPIVAEQRWLARASDLRRMSRTPEAIDALARAAAELPADFVPHRWMVVLSTDLSHTLAREGRSGEALASLTRAAEHLQSVVPLGINAGSIHRLLAQNAGSIAGLTHDSAYVEIARAEWRETLKLRPYSLPDHLAFADLSWDVGQRDEAKALYRRCLELDGQAYLDPVRQLLPQDKARAEASIAEPGAARP